MFLKNVKITSLLFVYLFSFSPKCGDKVEVYAAGWKIGTSCPAFIGPFNLEIKIGETIDFAGNMGEIVMKSDGIRANGKGFKALYRFEGQ